MRIAIPKGADSVRVAIQEAVDHLMTTYDVRCIAVGGSILRGEGHATSDLDVMVIHAASWRQRSQFRANGIPVEVFVNPEHTLRAAMQQEAADGRPPMVGLMRTAEIVFDPEGVAARLQAEAEAIWLAGPHPTAETIVQGQYRVACLLDDAIDVRAIDPDQSLAILVEAISGAVDLAFLRSGRWLPRPKTRFAAVEADDPETGALLRAVLNEWQAPGGDERARELVRRLAGESGFFAWESIPQEMPQPQGSAGTGLGTERLP